MSNVNPTSSGSGIWSKQHSEKKHLLTGPGGLASEVRDVRLDIAAVLSPQCGVTVDEWDAPATGSVLLLTLPAKVRMGAQAPLYEMMDGALISPPTGTLTQPGGAGTAWQYNPFAAPATGGAAIVAGTTDVTAGALYGVGGTLDSTKGVVTGTTDITAGALYGVGGTLAGGGTPLTLILNVNGAGPLTLTFDGTGATNDADEASLLAAIHTTWPALTATAGGGGGNKLVLTNSVRGSTSTVVVGAGTANAALGLSAPSNVSGVTSTLILTVNGALHTLTLNGSTNTATEVALLAAINAQWTGQTATQGGTGGNKLVLTDHIINSTGSIVVGSGTSNTALGLTPATTTGTGHSYAVFYEYDGTLVKDATPTVQGHAPYVNQNQGP